MLDMASRYHRPARVYPERVPRREVALAAPPAVRTQTLAWVVYLLPALSGVGALLFVFIYPGLLFKIMGGLVAALSLLSGLGLYFGQRLAARQQRRANARKYGAYLEREATRLGELAGIQARSLERLFPTPELLVELARSRRQLWERRRSDEDFLDVCVGRGRVPLACPARLELGSDPLVEHEPDLLALARRLEAQYRNLERGPVVLQLARARTVAIAGRRRLTHELVRALLCQAAVFHAPDDLQIMVFYPPEAAREWAWTRWLPHTRRGRAEDDGDAAICLLAGSPSEAHALYEEQVLPRVRRARTQDDRYPSAPVAPVEPHLLWVIDSFDPIDTPARLHELEECTQRAAAAGISLVCLLEDRAQEPSTLQARILVNETGLVSLERVAFDGERVEAARSDALNPAAAEAIARSLAPLQLDEPRRRRDLGRTVRLLDLLGLSPAGALDVEAAWQLGRAEPLRASIGARADGEPLVLDLKEAALGGIGPHGLVVGATGSGKSELLRTVVTSLAMTHDPELLSFVFVDFKGGAAFAELSRLPHCAGMITNIESDLTLVDRMLAALLGEQERRQRLLREAGNLDTIRQYHERRRRDPRLEALPYLLLVVDEFGELLASRPDFMELFLTLARVGRSLGMHLLLATQKLDEGRIRGLEGHLRYRICLRTFSAQESSAVLGTPEAYYLPASPGVGYFKADTNLEIFKTALVSTPVVEADRASRDGVGVAAVRVFTPGGRLVGDGPPVPAEVPEQPGGQRAAEPVTEMDVLIERLLWAGAGRPGAHQVWLPTLPSRLSLRAPTEPEADALSVVVGIVDVPRAQRQKALCLDFSGIGGHLAVVGAPQSGKSTLLRALVSAFALARDPGEVQLYCIDLGGGTLRPLSALPHVGGVCGKSDRELVLRMVRQVRTVIDEREHRFRELGIDSMATFRALRRQGALAGEPYGDVFLVVDDLGQLHSELEQVETELTQILAAGLSFGVHLVVAANRWADIRPKLRDQIGSRLELRLNDPADSELGRAVARLLPPGIPGRGLTRDGHLFQVAEPFAAEEVVARVAKAWPGGPKAPPVRVLPPLIHRQDLAPAGREDSARGHGVRLGVEESLLEPVAVDLESGEPHFLILGDSGCGKTNLVRSWIGQLCERRSPEEVGIVIVDYRRQLAELAGLAHLLGYAATPAAAQRCASALLELLRDRQAAAEEWPAGPRLHQRAAAERALYLFVDDYDWVGGLAGNPLAGLVEYLLPARDLGLHLVLARRVGGASRSAFEPVFQRLREMGTPGLLMDGDRQEGVVLGSEMARALPPGRGLLVRRGEKSVLVQTAWAGTGAAPALPGPAALADPRRLSLLR